MTVMLIESNTRTERISTGPAAVTARRQPLGSTDVLTSALAAGPMSVDSDVSAWLDSITVSTSAALVSKEDDDDPFEDDDSDDEIWDDDDDDSEEDDDFESDPDDDEDDDDDLYFDDEDDL